MPNYIGFKEDVDRYYRHYNTESAWGSVLANKVRQYNAYNQGILNQANQQNLNTIQYAQNEVSSIYSSYAQNRKAMENSGLSKYFTQRIFDDANPISRVAQQRAQQIISKNYVTPKLANINEDSAVQAYQQQVTGVSNMMSDMIQFFAENMVTKDGRQYQLADLVNDGYITKVGDGYQLTAAGISKLSELTAETEEGNPFETWMQDKYGDKYDPENAALYYQEASKAFGNEELAEGLPIAKPEGQEMPTSVDLPKYPDMEMVISGRIDPNEELGVPYKIQDNSVIKDMIFTDTDGNSITIQQAIESGRYDNIVFKIGGNDNGPSYYIRDGKVYIIYGDSTTPPKINIYGR